MKPMIILFSLSALLTVKSTATIHTITASGFNFVPNSITISLGDTINFLIESSHNALEVNPATWNANGTTSNGGFEVPFGGGIFVPTETRTYYYVCVPHASLGMKGTITVTSLTDIGPDPEMIPGSITLSQNYPNPFNPTTELSIVIGRLSFVSLKIYNTLGQEVAALINELKHPGEYTVLWNADNMASGLYTGVLTAGGSIHTRKMLLVR